MPYALLCFAILVSRVSIIFAGCRPTGPRQFAVVGSMLWTHDTRFYQLPAVGTRAGRSSWSPTAPGSHIADCPEPLFLEEEPRVAAGCLLLYEQPGQARATVILSLAKIDALESTDMKLR